MSDILKQAIADAKVVRETALANAKKALEEAFTPKLQSMISARIQQEVEGEDYDDNEMSEVDLSEVIAELENEVAETEVDEQVVEETEELTTEEEIDLDELYNSLQEVEETEEVETEIEPETETETAPVDDEEIDINIEDETEEPEVVAPETDEEGNETTEDWRAGYVLGYLAAQAELESEEDETETEEADDEIDINIEDDETEEEQPEVDNTELDALKESVDQLKNKLNEVNLLNAKLLYSNKLFSGFSLTESQKTQVLEAFDAAKTVNETKKAYNTLLEGLKKPIKKTVTESFASKTVASTKPAVMTEATDPMVSRFKKLANIK